ncbi:hypothetical protein ACHAXA_003967 [Cyclostephanos tholiformis]|uniref:Uncharacterized protein n=1 Tax=Cyclostephanos tholiformis TaxID=382380 RepID=A0ABD3R3U9_9STRA
MVNKKKKCKGSHRAKPATRMTANEDQSSGGAIETHGRSHNRMVASFNGEDLIHVSPSRIRFQHSRIRPYFSGCGRGVMETLEEIRRGGLEPRDLPPIQVLIGPDENDGLGPWYFSLNNRRLWVLKQCHREGLLDNARYNGTIAVRVRSPRSEAEAQRYTVDNCALEAKFTREGVEGGGGSKKKGRDKKGESIVIPYEKYGISDGGCDADAIIGATESKNATPSYPVGNGINEKMEMLNTNDSEDDSDSDDGVVHENPFSALL